MAFLEGDKYVLISQDLMRHLARFVEPPAQLCLIRVLGSDHEYVFRVRYQEAHLDYGFSVPLLDSAEKIASVFNCDELLKFLSVASAIVVPPEARNNIHVGYYPPQVLTPMAYGEFHRWRSPYE